ncbi:MAG TPA: hypothetical protein VG325_04835 [Solirubrobacteraceae bacterium]|nr:hypothetical protein [Solirubrobacteraceae bacterium]
MTPSQTQLLAAAYAAVHQSAGQCAGVARLARAPLTLDQPSCGLADARWQPRDSPGREGATART